MVESVCGQQGRKKAEEMKKSISHNRNEETIEAKTRWFQSLSLNERAELLCEFTDMILFINPNIVEKKDAQPVEGRILVLSET